MTKSINQLARFFVRFALLWVVDALSLLLAAALLPGMEFVAVGATPAWIVAVSAALVMALVNLLIRPLILLLARPLGFFVMFGVGFLVNAIVLLITADLLAPAFLIGGLLQAVAASVVLAIINAVLTGIIEVDDEGSFYQGRIERAARRDPFQGAAEPGRGLMMLEIDGLSYHHLHKALAAGLMPTLQAMIDEEGYALSKIDCGIPSQTSACQAGIMFGDNYDIPAFRWYDKTEQRLIVSGKDAAYLNARYAHGNGLMRGGTSISNMLNGDAEKSLLTVADIKTDDKEQQKRRAEDIRLLMLHPYFFMRTIALYFGNVLRELWEGWQQRRQDVTPRLNRLHGGYPFIRAATSTVVRDLAANLAILDIVRGSPSIYVTWPGYDEVAHHSGPWTNDAFGELKRYDRVIARVRRAVQERAPRPYDLVLLSDHGQSFGPTFKMRYGVTLKEFIEQQLPQGVTVAQSMGGDTGMTSLAGVSGELANVQQQEGGATGKAVAKQGQKLIDKGAKAQEGNEPEQPAQVTAYGSGNLAQVYFDLQPRKITLSELAAAYPGMVDALVQHEGIGLVCGYLDDGVPVALSKAGQRNLHSGEVTGEDPLLPYAPADPAAHGHASDRKARLAGAAGDGLPPRRRPDGDQRGLPGRHSGRAGGADRQPRRPGRRADRRLHLPSAGFRGARHPQLDRRLPHPQRRARHACAGEGGRRGQGRAAQRLGAVQPGQGDRRLRRLDRAGAASPGSGPGRVQGRGQGCPDDRAGAVDRPAGGSRRDALLG
ncbi:MAG: phage holin family protein [Anaerolineae bacterium]